MERWWPWGHSFKRIKKQEQSSFFYEKKKYSVKSGMQLAVTLFLCLDELCTLLRCGLVGGECMGRSLSLAKHGKKTVRLEQAKGRKKELHYLLQVACSKSIRKWCTNILWQTPFSFHSFLIMCRIMSSLFSDKLWERMWSKSYWS